MSFGKIRFFFFKILKKLWITVSIRFVRLAHGWTNSYTGGQKENVFRKLLFMMPLRRVPIKLKFSYCITFPKRSELHFQQLCIGFNTSLNGWMDARYLKAELYNLVAFDMNNIYKPVSTIFFISRLSYALSSINMICGNGWRLIAVLGTGSGADKGGRKKELGILTYLEVNVL